MKKVIIFFGSLLLIVLLVSVINNPTAEVSIIKTKMITNSSEGIPHDIVLNDAQEYSYKVNRELERGLNLDFLNTKVLNKKVTLHLTKVLGGFTISEHISQIAMTIIYTEFN